MDTQSVLNEVANFAIGLNILRVSQADASGYMARLIHQYTDGKPQLIAALFARWRNESSDDTRNGLALRKIAIVLGF